MREIRMRRNRRFHCETLEDRNLLSAVPGAMAEVQAVKSKVVTEVVQGTMTGTFVIHGSLVVIAAYGNLTNMGAAVIGSVSYGREFQDSQVHRYRRIGRYLGQPR